MLVNEIRNDPVLQKYICTECVENDFGVSIAPDVDDASIVIVKLDNYYNGETKNPYTPKSADCLIVQRCHDGYFRVFVVELKNAELGTFRRSDLQEKFNTCLLDFMSNRFRKIFYNPHYEFSLQVLFISDPLEIRNAQQVKMKRITKLDLLLSLPPLSFANRKLTIKHILPNPVINKC